MIASISKTSNYSKVIAYHEKKVKEGKATLLFDGTFSPDKDYSSAFDNHFCLYAKENMKNKVAHISISLPKGENLTDEKFLKIAREYMLKMGYRDCPFVIYKHTDKDHNHLHIVVSSINGEGKKVKEFYDFKRSQNISRELEKKHNLKNTEYNNRSESASLTEINFRKYYMHKAIFKASHGYNTKAYIESFFTEKEKRNIFIKDPLTQKQLQSILGKEKFDTLYNYLHEKKYFNSLFKDEISFKLDSLLKESKTLKDYISLCNKNNIYVRVMYGKDQNPYFKYGLMEEKVYFKDTNFSSRFRFNKVVESMGYTEGKGKRNMSQGEQFSYIDKNIKEGFGKGVSYIQFAEYLGQRGVEVILDESKNGPYNIRFKNCSASTPILFDCNDFGLTFKDIVTKANEPIEKISSLFDATVYENFLFQKEEAAIEPPLTKSKKFQEDHEILSLKKKKKGLGK